MRETAYDHPSFSAGRDCGTRIAACVARLAALELIDHARWWNRWRCRLMAHSLVTFAEELERETDAADKPQQGSAGILDELAGGSSGSTTS